MNDLTLAILFGLWSLTCFVAGIFCRRGLVNVNVFTTIEASDDDDDDMPAASDDPADAWKHRRAAGD